MAVRFENLGIFMESLGVICCDQAAKASCAARGRPIHASAAPASP